MSVLTVIFWTVVTILSIIVGLFGFYTIVRLATKAVLRSYHEEKMAYITWLKGELKRDGKKI